MRRPIAIGLSPNTQKEDVRLSFQLLLQPWRYVGGSSSRELERWFRTFFKISGAVSFVNARSALYAILHCLSIKSGDEVLLQAFTCVAVPNSVIATGAKPVYVDITDTYNIDPVDLERKISKKTKAIIVQHTFGFPAEMEVIAAIAKKHKLFLIEDCAHSIGGEYEKKKLGTFGIAACFSFGRDKAFSSVFGGMSITDDKELYQALRSYEKQRNFPTIFWVLQQLLYPIISSFILNFYYFFSIGKIVHFLLRRMNFFSEPVSDFEKMGEFTSREVKRFPNALAELALLQVKKYKEYNQTRKDIVSFYSQNIGSKVISRTLSLPLLRYPISVPDKQKCKAYFAKKGIFIGDWYRQIIDPKGVELAKIYYRTGSCPKAEELVKTVINLPTYPTMTMRDAEKTMKVLQEYNHLA